MRSWKAIVLVLAVSACSPPADDAAIDDPGLAQNNPLTPMDQGESDADRSLTQHVRQAILSDPALSMDARNVKIISRAGTVTLRGLVGSEDERRTVASIARSIAGVAFVEDQLEIAGPDGRQSQLEGE